MEEGLAVTRGLFYLQNAAARMAAVATDFCDVLVVSVLAVITAIFLISADSTSAAFVTASVIVVRHIILPCPPLDFAAK